MRRRCPVAFVTGAQLILAYSWARPAVLAAGKDRGGTLLFLLVLHFLSFPSFFPICLFHLLYYLPLFSHSLGEDTKWPTTQSITAPMKHFVGIQCNLSEALLMSTHSMVLWYTIFTVSIQTDKLEQTV